MPYLKSPEKNAGKSAPAIPSPYGLPIIEDCLTCKVREDRVFCNLSPSAIKSLNEIKSFAVYPKGAVLFVQGQPPRGVYVLCAGRVKLTVCSQDGRSLITRISKPGEVLGLSATLSGKPYYLTAETLIPSEVNFIKCNDFLRFLHEHGDACVRVAQQLAQNFQTATEQISLLGLSSSVSERLAKFLLSLEAREGQADGGLRLKLTYTHEEIGQMIGISRETVTRLLADFKKKQFINLKGSTLVISDLPALKALAGP